MEMHRRRMRGRCQTTIWKGKRAGPFRNQAYEEPEPEPTRNELTTGNMREMGGKHKGISLA